MYWTRRLTMCCVCLIALGWTTSAFPQSMAMPVPETVFQDSDAVLEGPIINPFDGGNYVLIDKMVGDGVGFNSGYTRLGLRGKVWENADSHFFMEGDVLLTDDGTIGGNAGGGYRWIHDDTLCGLHAWYDNFGSTNGFRYQQVTFGAERLSPWFDVRWNTYIPVGLRENLVPTSPPTAPLYEQAYYGGDLEFGIPAPLAPWLRLYAGPYYLSHSGRNTTGIRSRAEAKLAQGVTGFFMVTNDNMYGTNLNLDIEIRYSGQLPYRFGQTYSAMNRRYDEVRRTWPVQLYVRGK